LALLSGNEAHFKVPPRSWTLEVLFSCPLFLKACCPGKAEPAFSNDLPAPLPAGA